MRKIFIILMCISLLSGCSSKSSTVKVIWYMEEQSQSWLPSTTNYETVQSDRISAFNKEIKKMGMNIELILKTYPRCVDQLSCSLIVERIKERDADADVVTFNELYTSELEPLDEYLKTSQGAEILQQFSKERLETLKIHGSIYHIPKNIYPLLVPTIVIDSSYYDKHAEEIDDATRTPSGILTYFNQYYEKVEGKILFSGLSITPFLRDAYASIPHTPFFIRKEDHKIVNPFDEAKIKDIIRVLSEIRWKGHTGKDMDVDTYQSIVDSGNFILSSHDDSINNLEMGNTSMKIIPVENEYYTYESGFSILKDSSHKEEAFQLMYLMNTNKRCASILQFGVDPQRNEHGKIISEDHLSFGTWNTLGNNMIVESSENERENKKEYFKSLEEASKAHEHQLYPSVFDLSNLAKKIMEFDEIMDSSISKDTNIVKCMACNVMLDTIQEPDSFMQEIEKINEKLRKAGIDDIIKNFQQQLDRWLKDEIGS